MVSARFLGGLNTLGAIERQGLYFLRLTAEKIRASIVGVLFGLESGRLIAREAASIYFTDQGQKVESGFGLCINDLPDGLVPSIFLTGVLFSLGMDRKL